jgi:hypothetical protein
LTIWKSRLSFRTGEPKPRVYGSGFRVQGSGTNVDRLLTTSTRFIKESEERSRRKFLMGGLGCKVGAEGSGTKVVRLFDDHYRTQLIDYRI